MNDNPRLPVGQVIAFHKQEAESWKQRAETAEKHLMLYKQVAATLPDMVKNAAAARLDSDDLYHALLCLYGIVPTGVSPEFDKILKICRDASSAHQELVKNDKPEEEPRLPETARRRFCLTCKHEPDWKGNHGKCKSALADFGDAGAVMMEKTLNPDEVYTAEGQRVMNCTAWEEKEPTP